MPAPRMRTRLPSPGGRSGTPANADGTRKSPIAVIASYTAAAPPACPTASRKRRRVQVPLLPSSEPGMRNLRSILRELWQDSTMQMRAIFAILLSVACLTLFAQTTASLTGVVKHESEQPLAGVTVTIESPALQGARTAVTNEAGVYEFAALPPGEYKVTFTLQGAAQISKRT